MGRLEVLFRLAQGVLLRDHPGYLVYFVTSRCNCRCAMCFNRENVAAAAGQRELSPDEVEKVARSCRPLPQLLLSGGEPFLRRDIADIVFLFCRHAATGQISIPTNGSATEQVLWSVEDMLARCPGALININLSLDGIGEEHDRLRGLPGCFESLCRTHDGLIRLRERNAGLTVNILTTIQPENAGRMGEIMDFAAQRFDANYHSVVLERGCRSSALDSVRADLEGELERRYAGTGGVRAIRGLTPAAQALSRLVRKTLRAARTQARRPFPCKAGRKMVVLSADGMLYPCEPLWLEPQGNAVQSNADFRIADLREYDFDVSRALRSPQARAVGQYIDAERCTCEYGCAVLNSVLYSPRMYPRLLREIVRGR